MNENTKVVQKAKEMFQRATGATITKKSIRLYESGHYRNEIDYILFAVGDHGYKYILEKTYGFEMTIERLFLYPFDTEYFDMDSEVLILEDTKLH